MLKLGTSGFFARSQDTKNRIFGVGSNQASPQVVGSLLRIDTLAVADSIRQQSDVE